MNSVRERVVRRGKQCLASFRCFHNGFIRGTLSSAAETMKVGQYAEISRVFKPEEIHQYGILIGDMNPIHLNRGDGKIVVHGMLTSSLFSSIFGTLIPGSVYRSQSLLFHSPIYCNEVVLGKVKVTSVVDRKRLGVLVMCQTTVEKYTHDDTNIICVSGTAEVLLPR